VVASVAEVGPLPINGSWSKYALGLVLHMIANRVTSILAKARAAPADMALCLGQHCRTSAVFWRNPRNACGQDPAERAIGGRIRAEVALGGVA
jgi:plasmid maintenance system antidote protein VapI